MILPQALALSAQLIVLVAASDRMPELNVEPVCKGIAEQGGVTFRDPSVGQEKNNCIESEQAVRAQVLKEWSNFVPADRTHCVNETTMGGLSSYTELITCLEMARDVRGLRSAEAAPSQAATARSPSPPSTPTVQPVPSTATVQPIPSPPAAQPTPANPHSRPSSPIEPQTRTDSTLLKELQQAKADALDAKTSEAAARRKLADAEADLKRAKEEAARASQEAKQARADAQSARESQAKAENKVADLEAARTAAEEQVKACQNAPKSQSGFGARLRSWFGHKPSNP